MAKDLSKIAKQKKIKYFLISFVDLFGVLRSKLVPAQAIKEMQKNGAGFAGFATWLDMSPADPDMFAIPDPDSLIQLPWKKEVGWLASDLWMNGKPVEASPRVMLKKQVTRLSKNNMTLKSGVECEYFLTNPDGTAIADNRDIQSKPCYDQSALMRQYDLIKEICDSMIKLNWNPYQNDHEDANGQFEMNWDYTDSLNTADRHVFFKFMVKTIAEKHGLRATFMPKPFENLTGNGCHAHISLWHGSKNLFLDKGDKLGLTRLAYNFLGGILNSAEALSAFFNPSINSYRRIDAPVTVRAPEFWWRKVHLFHSIDQHHLPSQADSPDERLRSLRPACRVQDPFLTAAQCAVETLFKIRLRTGGGSDSTAGKHGDDHLLHWATINMQTSNSHSKYIISSFCKFFGS